MNPAATPVPGGPRPASPAAGSQDGPSTTVRIRPDIAALPALADAMARRGIGPQQIQAIFFDNAADFFERRLSSF